MNVISPIQSAIISCEILAQAVQLAVIASNFKPPWGDLSKARALRLRSGRLHVVLPIPGASQ